MGEKELAGEELVKGIPGSRHCVCKGSEGRASWAEGQKAGAGVRSERKQGQARRGQEGQRYLLFMAEDAGFHRVFFRSKSVVGAPGDSVSSASDS